MTEALRACPFCGGADIGTERHGNEYLTLCYSCVRSGSRYGKTRLEAVEIWNHRAPVALPSREEVAEVVYDFIDAHADRLSAADAILNLMRERMG